MEGKVMPCAVRLPGPTGAQVLAQHVRRRLGLKLARVAGDVICVAVSFTAPSAPSHAGGTVCRIHVVVRGGGRVVLRAGGADAREAFDRTSDSIERSVRRLLAPARRLGPHPAHRGSIGAPSPRSGS